MEEQHQILIQFFQPTPPSTTTTTISDINTITSTISNQAETSNLYLPESNVDLINKCNKAGGQFFPYRDIGNDNNKNNIANSANNVINVKRSKRNKNKQNNKKNLFFNSAYYNNNKKNFTSNITANNVNIPISNSNPFVYSYQNNYNGENLYEL